MGVPGGALAPVGSFFVVAEKGEAIGRSESSAREFYSSRGPSAGRARGGPMLRHAIVCGIVLAAVAAVPCFGGAPAEIRHRRRGELVYPSPASAPAGIVLAPGG